MPRGVRNLDSVNGLTSKLNSLENKRQKLADALDEIEAEIISHETKRDELLRQDLINAIMKSGKSTTEIRTALGL